MQKNETTNGFKDALNLDYSPLLTPNTVMTNALNATLLTMNGNELTLQNDMGNGRVETAYLPEGYIPLGSAELGGIVYIVSYNPLRDMCLIGSFPSPERNITSEETNETTDKLEEVTFYKNNNDEDPEYWDISTPYKRLDITDFELNPGDKYLIYFKKRDVSEDEEDNKYDYISAYGETTSFNPRLLPRYVRFSIVSIASNGLVIDMTDSCVWLPLESGGYYFMSDKNPSGGNEGADVDDYRDLVTSNYNVFSCKSSGKLGILAQLECIDSFEITWDALKFEETVLDEEGKPKTDDNGNEITANMWHFYFFTNWTYKNDIEPDKINLYGLYVKGTIDESESDEDIVVDQYPYFINGISLGGTDIMIHLQVLTGTDEYNIQFLNPRYIDSLSDIYDEATEKGLTIKEYLAEYFYVKGDLSLRKNNGSDNQFLIGTPYITEKTEGILKLEITPTMPYGKLSWLELTFNIDLSKLGTGEIDLVEYRYYILNNGATLLWGLDAYPERNKKINKVDFNFYEIDDGIITWIKDNENYIDSCKVIGESWVNGDSEEVENKVSGEISNIVDYSFTVSGKSSYSGHFQESLNFYEEGEQDGVLIQNKVYLLLINIDYSGSTITYYRIFYTEPIFNRYYYNDEYLDYAKIDLNEELTYSFNIENVNLNVTTDTTPIIHNGDGEVIDEIPSYKLDISYDETLYTIEHPYTETVTFEVDATVGYDSFIVNCDFDGKNIGYSFPDAYAEDLNTEPMYNTGISSRTITTDVNPVCNPYFKDENNPITINRKTFTLTDFIATVYCPVVIIYDKQSAANIEYELLHPTCTTYNIVGDGGKETVAIRIDKYLSVSYNSSDWSYHQNETLSRINISTTGNINDTISNALKDYDFVCIGGAMTNGSNEDKHPWGVAWGWGSVMKADINNGQIHENDVHLYSYQDLWWSNLSNTDYYNMILFYATQYGNDILLFTYLLPNPNTQTTIQSYTNEWFDSGKSTISPNYRMYSYNNLNKMYSHGFSISDITESGMINQDVAEAPFTRLYKPVSSGEAWTIYEWSVIKYAHNYYEDYYVNITVEKVDVELTINNECAIPTNLTVNNLHYTSPTDCTIKYDESRRINNESIIDNVSNSSDQHLVIYENDNGEKELINLAVSSNSAYVRNNDGTFSIAKYLYNINNENSALEIRCSDGLIRAQRFTGDTINAVWAYDDQGVAIENVCLIK